MNKYQYKVQGVDYEVEIVDVDGNTAKVNVNGIPFEVEMKRPITPANKPHHKATQTSVITKSAPQPPQEQPVTPSKAQSYPPASGTKVPSPLPGTITEVKVNVGDIVKEGDTVVILEAMKMQNNIEAECSGTVTAVLVNKGDTVMEGDVLITIG